MAGRLSRTLPGAGAADVARRTFPDPRSAIPTGGGERAGNAGPTARQGFPLRAPGRTIGRCRRGDRRPEWRRRMRLFLILSCLTALAAPALPAASLGHDAPLVAAVPADASPVRGGGRPGTVSGTAVRRAGTASAAESTAAAAVPSPREPAETAAAKSGLAAGADPRGGLRRQADRSRRAADRPDAPDACRGDAGRRARRDPPVRGRGAGRLAARRRGPGHRAAALPAGARPTGRRLAGDHRRAEARLHRQGGARGPAGGAGARLAPGPGPDRDRAAGRHPVQQGRRHAGAERPAARRAGSRTRRWDCWGAARPATAWPAAGRATPATGRNPSPHSGRRSPCSTPPAAASPSARSRLPACFARATRPAQSPRGWPPPSPPAGPRPSTRARPRPARATGALASTAARPRSSAAASGCPRSISQSRPSAARPRPTRRWGAGRCASRQALPRSTWPAAGWSTGWPRSPCAA